MTQFFAKLKFALTVLVTSWTEKKQRRQSAGTLLALNASLCPLLLAVITVSALLSAPLLSLFTLPIFLVGFPRPQRSWPGPVGTACPCPDSIFYQQMSGSLASALSLAFTRGSLGWFPFSISHLNNFIRKLVKMFKKIVKKFPFNIGPSYVLYFFNTLWNMWPGDYNLKIQYFLRFTFCCRVSVLKFLPNNVFFFCVYEIGYM